MILAARQSQFRRVAALGLVAMLFAGCSQIPNVTPTPSPAPADTVPPAAPAFSLAPAPSNCPTAAPAALTGTATVTVVTNFGKIVIKADASLGPNAAGTFVALSQCGYYNNVIFHRIVKKFIIQSGDGTYGREPDLTLSKVGQGGPDWTIKDDAVNTPLKRGMVALAEKSGQPNSANSKFFIILDDKAFPATTKDYPIVGTVTEGMEIVDLIAKVPTGGEPETQGGPAGSGTQPLQPIVILSTTVTTP
jgi:cyclophilin family peptidyl-prolyl cis-trans isomerase